MNEDIRVTLRNKGFLRQPDGSYSKPDVKAVAAGPCTGEPECYPGRGSLGACEDEKKGPGRRLLRITTYRTRLIDPDNNVAKWEVDALRYAGVIEDDSADHIEILTRQVKVASKDQIGTEITIEKL